MMQPMCRLKLQADGLPYPKSNCDKCGSIIREGWAFAEKVSDLDKAAREVAIAIASQAWKTDNRGHQILTYFEIDVCAEIVKAALLAQRQRADYPNWQPIETAPKDGTWIWGYIPIKVIPNGKRKQFNPPKMLAIHWRSGPVINQVHTPPKLALKLAEERGGYWSASHHGFRPTEGHPSHWMPLPTPPETP